MATNPNSNPEQSTFLPEGSPLPHARKTPEFHPDTPLVPLGANTLKTYTALYERAQRVALAKRQTSPEDHVEITPADLVNDWFTSLDATSLKTANTQRAAIIRMLQEKKPNGWEEPCHRLRVDGLEAMSNQRRQESNSDRRTRTPGRMIPEKDLKILINTLANMRKAGARAQWWLVAGIASGARPIEWVDAEWINREQTVLRIYTAKVKARNAWHKIPPMTFTAEDYDNEVGQLWGGEQFARGSAHNMSYYDVDFARRIAGIPLTQEEADELKKHQYKNGVLLFRDVLIEPEYRMFVRIHMEEIARTLAAVKERFSEQGKEPPSDEEIFTEACFNPVRNTIYRACKRAFPDKLYSLADTRSTFSANRKASMGLQSASADLGHTSITSSRDFYAPASKAWARYKPATKPIIKLPPPAEGNKPARPSKPMPQPK